MKIDWASLGLVAVTTVVAAMAIIGLYSAGVIALTSGQRQGGGQATSGGAKFVGYACIVACAAIVLFGIYLIVPYFH